MSIFGKSNEAKSDAQISVIAQIRAKSGHESEVRTMLEGLAGPSQKEAGCLKYHVFEDKYYTGSFSTYEEWESEQALETHLAGAKDALNKVKPLLREEMTISVLRQMA